MEKIRGNKKLLFIGGIVGLLVIIFILYFSVGKDTPSTAVHNFIESYKDNQNGEEEYMVSEDNKEFMELNAKLSPIYDRASNFPLDFRYLSDEALDGYEIKKEETFDDLLADFYDEIDMGDISEKDLEDAGLLDKRLKENVVRVPVTLELKDGSTQETHFYTIKEDDGWKVFAFMQTK
ncbi:hypothetical protein ABES03_25055 [Neobacillus rhizosphaerae]|uniref:hypothetical protein n=1 Tax=Neobacillus rhizosphaerae TaxID=2880965 RepID=UPI003D2C5672